MDAVTLILFLLGLGLLVGGAEVLVRGASHLAAIVGISPLVVGLTVVAFATSTPELAVSLTSTWQGDAGLAVGNVVGSNIANILLILGLSATVAPLAVAQKLIRLDIPLMIGLSGVVWLMAFDGSLGRADGAILSILLVAYIAWTIRESRRETRRVQKEYEEEYAPKDGSGTLSTKVVLSDLLLIALGFGMLLLGARWLVDGAVKFALYLGASKLVVGLTVVAIGTSLPELATSIVASLRGQRDIAVGNAIGSNILNILSVLGLTALGSPTGIEVAKEALYFDLPVMIGVAVACLPVLFIDYRINRWEGWLFVVYYAAYLTYLVLEAQGNEALPMFERVLVNFMLPVTVITVLFFLWRFVKKPREADA